MTFSELLLINQVLKAKKENIMIPKSFFKLGLTGTSMILYDILSKIQYRALESEKTPIFNLKLLSNSTKFEEETIINGIKQLMDSGILIVTDKKSDDEYEYELNYSFVLTNDNTQ